MPEIQEEITAAQKDLQLQPTVLHRFVMVVANWNHDGTKRLYTSEDAREVLLYWVWLQACKEIGVKPEIQGVK